MIEYADFINYGVDYCESAVSMLEMARNDLKEMLRFDDLNSERQDVSNLYFKVEYLSHGITLHEGLLVSILGELKKLKSQMADPPSERIFVFDKEFNMRELRPGVDDEEIARMRAEEKEEEEAFLNDAETPPDEE